MDSRSFKNPYLDYEGPASTERLFDSAGRLTSSFIQHLQSKISDFLQYMENGLLKADQTDCSTYTGWTGIALLYLHLYNVYGDQSFLQKAVQYVNKSLKCLTGRVVTFLCGDAGPLALAAVVYHKLQQMQESDNYINQLLRLHQSVVKPSSRLPDELLYGRMGYLYALLFVNQQFGNERIPLQYMQEICSAAITSGRKLGSKTSFSKSPLMYEWYQEHYVGAAHGLAGIYYFLMQVFKDEKYLKDASDCTEVIWQRGLLKKGYGLCHGPAGNAYGFLAMFNLTQDKKYLYRACKFAEWCLDYGKHGCRTPDSPFSLFEGVAGTIYFLADLLQPTKAKFPAFEV
ncbi:glutathione S-transferase LANCL1 isoform X2 [Pristis pectinata]|uniref:glutathione S-transferase LANCL1 isoform X2 n=1 Tax=Pristis pectinata TaxID=685728 RepID=UPI00223CD9DB|nr:glutathione S-transferase LANCL1 isoform X2 [Pristis pectinata]